MSSTSVRFRRNKVAVGAAIVAAGLAAWAVPAGAHLEPSPAEVEAGETATITFTVPHGCDGSPTTKLVIQLPEGVTNATAGTVDGWEGSIDGREVTFTGGPLADDEQLGFPVTMTMPAQDGYLAFPTVQTCEKGETHWIETASGGEEPEHPAPVVKLTEPERTPISVPETTVAGSAGGIETTTAPDTTTTTTVEADDTDDDDGTSGGQLVGIVAIVAAAAVAITAIVVRRKGDDDKGDEPSAGGDPKGDGAA